MTANCKAVCRDPQWNLHVRHMGDMEVFIPCQDGGLPWVEQPQAIRLGHGYLQVLRPVQVRWFPCSKWERCKAYCPGGDFWRSGRIWVWCSALKNWCLRLVQISSWNIFQYTSTSMCNYICLCIYNILEHHIPFCTITLFEGWLLFGWWRCVTSLAW